MQQDRIKESHLSSSHRSTSQTLKGFENGRKVDTTESLFFLCNHYDRDNKLSSLAFLCLQPNDNAKSKRQ